MNLHEKLRDFEYEEIELPTHEIFPKLNFKEFTEQYGLVDLVKVNKNPHKIILQILTTFWDEVYAQFLEKYGFYDQKYIKFSGHCHQISPIDTVAFLATNYFEKVVYDECFRVDPKTGEKIDPINESNPEMREEFCGIGRIPYCRVGLQFDNRIHYVDGKHLNLGVDQKPQALLAPECYEDMVGVFAHQNNPSRSGVYLRRFYFPWMKHDEPPVWEKRKIDPQTGVVLEPGEFFRTYKRITITV